MSALLASPLLTLQLVGLWSQLLVSGLGRVLAPWSPACLPSARQRGYGMRGPAGIGVFLHLNGSLGPGHPTSFPSSPSLSLPFSLPLPPFLYPSCLPFV